VLLNVSIAGSLEARQQRPDPGFSWVIFIGAGGIRQGWKEKAERGSPEE
jgi:hypothetical protein